MKRSRQGESVSDSNCEIIYFHSGKSLPRHLKTNITHTARRLGRELTLLTDVQVGNVRGARVVSFTDFFDDRAYQDFKRRAQLPAHFREDFWSKASLRFFVLLQYAKLSSLQKFLHIESDVVLLGEKDLLPILDDHGSGVFYPVISGHLAISSFFYCNSIAALEAFVGSFQRAKVGDSEMEILASFAKQEPAMAYALPNAATFLRQARVFSEIAPSRMTGVVDAAQIGHWLMGEDPRNRPGKLVRNRYVVDYGAYSLLEIKSLLSSGLRFDARLKSPVINHEGVTYPVRCIHVHSKTLGLVSRPWGLRLILCLTRWGSELPLPVVPVLVNYSRSQSKRRIDILLIRISQLWRLISAKIPHFGGYLAEIGAKQKNQSK